MWKDLLELLPTKSMRAIAAGTLLLAPGLFLLIHEVSAELSLTSREVTLVQFLVSLSVITCGALVLMVLALVAATHPKPVENEPIERRMPVVPRPEQLDNAKEALLRALYNRPRQHTSALATATKMDEETTRFHVDELYANGYLSNVLIMGKGAYWSLDQGGRRYCVEKLGIDLA